MFHADQAIIALSIELSNQAQGSSRVCLASAQLLQCMADSVWCVQETWDILCLLVMIRINYHHQLIMNKRRIPCLDDYLDRINLTLWPRFKVIQIDISGLERAKTSPQCRNVFLLSPGVSRFRFSLWNGCFLSTIGVSGLKRAACSPGLSNPVFFVSLLFGVLLMLPPLPPLFTCLLPPGALSFPPLSHPLLPPLSALSCCSSSGSSSSYNLCSFAVLWKALNAVLCPSMLPTSPIGLLTA